MATCRAIQQGLWSSASTWNNEVKPSAGDTVYANGYIVTIDEDVLIDGGSYNPEVSAQNLIAGQYYKIVFVGTTNFGTFGASGNTVGLSFLCTTNGNINSGTGLALALGTITTLANTAAGAAQGGNFTFDGNDRTIRCQIRSGTTTCLQHTLVGETISIYSEVCIGSIIVSNINGMTLLGTGNVYFEGSLYAATNNSCGGIVGGSLVVNIVGQSIGGNSSGSNGDGLRCSDNTNTTFIGNIFAGNTSANRGLVMSGDATVTVNGNVYGSNSTNINNIYGILHNGLGTLTINGIVTAGFSPGVYNVASSGTVVINGAIYASQFTSGYFGNGNNVTNIINASLYDHINGTQAIVVFKFKTGVLPVNITHRKSILGTSTTDFNSADNNYYSLPSISNVRKGVTYASNSLVGTLNIPPVSAVQAGIEVDNTTGIAVLRPTTVQAIIGSVIAAATTL